MCEKSIAWWLFRVLLNPYFAAIIEVVGCLEPRRSPNLKTLLLAFLAVDGRTSWMRPGGEIITPPLSLECLADLSPLAGLCLAEAAFF